MRKYLLIIFLALFSFSAIHAEIEWTLSEDGTLTISGTGDMPDYGHIGGYPSNIDSAPWYSQREKIHNVVIENGVKNIGNYSFSRCSRLVSVSIPNSVTSIGNRAFLGCCNLISIVIPNSVTEIKSGAFCGCSGLTSITFKGNMPPLFDKNVFKDVNKSIPVHVPANSIEAYKEALKDYFEEGSIQALQR